MEIKRRIFFRTTWRIRLLPCRFLRNSLLLDDFCGEKNFSNELHKYPRNENSAETVPQIEERKFLRSFHMVLCIS